MWISGGHSSERRWRWGPLDLHLAAGDAAQPKPRRRRRRRRRRDRGGDDGASGSRGWELWTGRVVWRHLKRLKNVEKSDSKDLSWSWSWRVMLIITFHCFISFSWHLRWNWMNSGENSDVCSWKRIRQKCLVSPWLFWTLGCRQWPCTDWDRKRSGRDERRWTADSHN